jgi:hypothetical protein
MYSSPHSASPRAGLVCAAALALIGGEAAAQALPSFLIWDQPVITGGPRHFPLFLMRSAQGG